VEACLTGEQGEAWISCKCKLRDVTHAEAFDASCCRGVALHVGE
jgi:hypothetical protein